MAKCQKVGFFKYLYRFYVYTKTSKWYRKALFIDLSYKEPLKASIDRLIHKDRNISVLINSEFMYKYVWISIIIEADKDTVYTIDRGSVYRSILNSAVKGSSRQTCS
jgi:hypothetical protein